MSRFAIKILSATLAGLAMALAASAQTAVPFGNIPLFFEAGAPGQFLANGANAQFLIAPAETQFILRKSAVESAAVRMQFVGANPRAQVSGTAELAGKINYLIGNDPAQWRRGVPTFAKVSVTNIYPGIGLVYYGNQHQLEYDFNVSPDANPDAIMIHFDGVNKISINARGELVLTVDDGEILQPKPVIYQILGGTRQEISGGYKIVNANTVAFSLGDYNHSLPLTIDPILSYSTYFGGDAGDTAWAVAVNPNDGSVYIAGQTFSKLQYTNGPPFSTTNAFQTNFQGGTLTGDAFVAKFDNLGTNLLYLTYLGGSADDIALGIAVDNSGDAYVTGYTDSTNFPTKNALYPNISGTFNEDFKAFFNDAFVSELDAGGSNLIYSTYLGGSAVDAAYGIAVDPTGNAYVAGVTSSTNFPTTNAIQSHLMSFNSIYYNANAFVTEIANGGGSLIFSTYLGGTNFDEARGIAVDTNGFIYVGGFTDSTNFPITNAIPGQTYLNGATNGVNGIYYGLADDAFVTKYFPSGSNYVYSTFLGGTNNDNVYSIAADNSGAAYVTGWTVSTNFPVTVTNVPGLYSFVASNGFVLATNAFLTKITNGAISSNGAQAGIAYSALFGGYASDIGYGVAVDPAGNAFVVGTATSTNFPTWNTSGLLSATNSGDSDAFVTAFNTNASVLLYSTDLGGNNNDYGYAIATDPAGNAYVVGQTLSTNFPTLNAFHNKLHNTNDAFLAKILLAPQPVLTITPENSNSVALAWRAFQPEYDLESNTNVAASNTWITVPQPPVLSNGWHTVTLPSTNDDSFFRLHKF